VSKAWTFVKNNQATLTWLGGGVAIAAGGLWTAFVYFFPPQSASKSAPAPVAVEANCGGVAVGGNVSGGTITAGDAANADCAPQPK
jgi:hypothetical protein